MFHCKRKKINVEIESTMQNARGMVGQSYPVTREKYTKSMKLKTDYYLEFGVCLRITDIFFNGCVYEEQYGTEINPLSESPAQDSPRKVGFAKWNERVSIFVPYPPTDVLCNLYITFKVSKSEKQSLPEREFLLPEKKSLPREDEKWICPACGVSSTTLFCPNCGRVRGMKVVAKSNVCYFDAKGEVCEKENAVTCIITEYDIDGKLLNSVHGYVNGSRNLNNNIVEELDDDETMWLCPICKTFNRFNSKYCKNCGHPR